MRNLGITIAAVIGLLLGWYERSHAQFAVDPKPAPKEVVVQISAAEPNATRATE